MRKQQTEQDPEDAPIEEQEKEGRDLAQQWPRWEQETK